MEQNYPMTAKECADVLRSFLHHRKQMHGKEILLIEEDGSEAGRGRLTIEEDILYHAAKFALACVEEKIPQ